MSNLWKVLVRLARSAVFVFLIIVSTVGFFCSLHAGFLFFEKDDPSELWVMLITFVAMVILCYIGSGSKSETDEEDIEEETIEVSACKIFTASMEKTGEIGDLQESVNALIEKYPDSTITWLQSVCGSITTLTAIVEYIPYEEDSINEAS